MEVAEKIAIPSGYDLLIERIQTGHSYQKIGKQYNTSHQNIRQKINKFLDTINPHIIKLYEEKPNEAIRILEGLFVDEMSNPEKIKKANLVQLSTAFGIIYDKRRLEEGKSTENVDFKALILMEQEIKSRIKQPQSVPVKLSTAFRFINQ
jgi:hypothetical protein